MWKVRVFHTSDPDCVVKYIVRSVGTVKRKQANVDTKQNMYFNHKNYGQEVPSAAPQDPVADCPKERDVPSLKVQTKTLFVFLDQS